MASSLENIDYENTLDPPGRIAVVGAGPLGIEAALYGRFLGYEVTVFEKGLVGQSLQSRLEDPLPMLPDRCLSPLAVSALKAHDGGVALAGDPTFPMTIGQWVTSGLVRLSDTDLLVERVLVEHEVVGISTVENTDDDATVEDDNESETYIDGEVPPDFRLLIRCANETATFECEAVIFAIGVAGQDSIEGFSTLAKAPYLFRIGHREGGSDEETLHLGWHEIVQVFAMLGGRRGLDLYRPIRS
jgi:hypothetical protein